MAVIYGLGVMTKVSVGVIALFTAVVFVIMLVKTVKTDAKQWKMLMLRYIVFGLISLPLGLWYSVRNYRMFGQPLGYVCAKRRPGRTRQQWHGRRIARTVPGGLRLRAEPRHNDKNRACADCL